MSLAIHSLNMVMEIWLLWQWGLMSRACWPGNELFPTLYSLGTYTVSASTICGYGVNAIVRTERVGQVTNYFYHKGHWSLSTIELSSPHCTTQWNRLGKCLCGGIYHQRSHTLTHLMQFGRLPNFYSLPIETWLTQAIKEQDLAMGYMNGSTHAIKRNRASYWVTHASICLCQFTSCCQECNHCVLEAIPTAIDTLSRGSLWWHKCLKTQFVFHMRTCCLLCSYQTNMTLCFPTGWIK